MDQEHLQGRLERMRQEIQLEGALASGLNPLRLYYRQVNGCDENAPEGYRTVTVIDSTVLGRLLPTEYRESVKGNETGRRLTAFSIREALRAGKALEEAGRKGLWVSAYCDISFALDENAYTFMENLLKEENISTGNNLVLEVSEDLLKVDTEKARQFVLDMKLLGIRTLISGVGGDTFPLSKLVKVPVSGAILTEETTNLSGDRNKEAVFPALVAYLNSMKVEVYAEGIRDDEQIRLLARAGCQGYLFGQNYRGKITADPRYMSFSVALKQKDAEELDDEI